MSHDYQQTHHEGPDHDPAAGSTALGVRDGDEIKYEIKGDRVILTKAKPAPVDDPFHAFDEWDSEADRRAYAKL